MAQKKILDGYKWYFNNFRSKNFSCKATWLFFLPVTAGAPSVQILPNLNQSSVTFFFPTICHIFNKFSQFFKQVWGSSVEQNGQRPSNSLNYSRVFLTHWTTTVNCAVSVALQLPLVVNKKKCLHESVKNWIHAVASSRIISALLIVMLHEELWTYQLCAALLIWFVQQKLTNPLACCLCCLRTALSRRLVICYLLLHLCCCFQFTNVDLFYLQTRSCAWWLSWCEIRLQIRSNKSFLA